MMIYCTMYYCYICGRTMIWTFAPALTIDQSSIKICHQQKHRIYVSIHPLDTSMTGPITSVIADHIVHNLWGGNHGGSYGATDAKLALFFAPLYPPPRCDPGTGNPGSLRLGVKCQYLNRDKWRLPHYFQLVCRIGSPPRAVLDWFSTGK